MDEEYTPVNEMPEENKNKKLWIILGVVVILLCCLCLAVGGAVSWLWENGDQFLDFTMGKYNIIA